MSKLRGCSKLCVGILGLLLGVAGICSGPTLTWGAPTPAKVFKIEEPAKKSRTAKEAVTAYEIFLTDPKLTSTEKTAAEEKLEQWKNFNGADEYLKLAAQDMMVLDVQINPGNSGRERI